MNQVDSQIVKFIKRVRRRMTEQKILRYGVWGAIGGFGVAVICSIVALIVPWYYAPLFAMTGACVGILAGIILGIIKKPDMKEAALGLDAHGFHERLITSYELVGKEDAFSRVQKQDTLRRLGNFQIRKTFPLKLRWQMLMTMLGLAASFAIISFIPTAAKEAAQEYHEIASQVDEEIEKVEEAIEAVEKIDDLSELEKENMLSVLEEAKRELQEAENADDLERAKERIEVKATQEANQTESRSAREALQSLASAMADEPKTEEQQLAQDLSDLEKDLQNLDENTSQADREAIANEMQRLGQLTNNQTLQSQAQNVMNNTATQEQLSQAQQAASSEQQAAQNSSQTASNSQSSQTGQSSQNNQTSQNNQSNQTSQNNQNSQSSQTSQNNQSNQTNQNNQTNQTSQTNQNNQNNQNGQSGQNAQNGQNGQSGQSGSGSQGTGYDTGSNQGTQKDTTLDGQMITIPNREEQDNESLNSKINTNGTGTMEKGGEAWAGTSVDYQQVIGDYSQNAYSKVESTNYPSGVQDIVKSYFEELNK